MAATWILRKGSKRTGFRYEREGGGAVSDARTLGRIDALRVPPAWTEVHVAASPSSAVQAWGFDARGRKQYRYHDAAVERSSLRKYHRVRQLARDLPAIRRRVEADFRGRGLTRRRVTAGVVKLIGEAFFRVGSERYAKENRTFGLTTLLKRHVHTEGDVAVFSYVGKESVQQRQVICSRALARFVAELERTPGRRLFRYRTPDGAWCDLTARDVNEYLHELVGVPYTAKDFRTWGGTLRAATILSDFGPARSEREARKNVVTAVRLVAAELGNTPTVCRGSYIHPIVLSKYQDEGLTIAPRGPRGAASGAGAHTPEERALMAFLERHFPERRRRPRQEAERAA